MSEVIKVGMADLNVCKAPDVITTLGLGSCIGLVFYDPVSKLGNGSLYAPGQYKGQK